MGVKRWKCECGKGFSRRFDLRKHKARCDVLVAAGGGKLGGAGVVPATGLYPRVPAVISVLNTPYICGEISDVDTDSMEGGMIGEQKGGGMPPIVVSGSESDREEDIKASEALLWLRVEASGA
jgi:hypothetical protein